MVEFRLYYDDNGNVLCYSADSTGPDANYIIVDTQVYAEGRVDIKVVDGKITKPSGRLVISKMIPDNEGTRCAIEDITIIVTDEYSGETMNWKSKQYEYGCS